VRKYLFIAVGIILVIAAIVLKFGLSQSAAARFPNGWSWEINSIGVTGYADEETGKFEEGTTLEDDPINLSVRTVTASASDAPAGQVVITDQFVSRNAVTNAIDWEFTANATVDSVTGQYVDGPNEGDYYFLPRNVDKNATYVISNSNYVGLPMTFQREEVVSGIKTYLFANYDAFDNTAGNASFVDLEPGQTVMCLDFALEYWVEPTTGEIVKYREWCEGDWVIDAETGEPLYAISRWGGETTGDDLIRSAANVRSKLNTHNWMSLYGPLLTASLGLVAMAGAFFPGLSRNE
jgi:hypothetical protein